MSNESFTRAATVAPSSINDANRTVEVVWSTGAAVRRRDVTGSFLEVLSLDPAHVDLSRLIGASVLDAHRQVEVHNVLGVVLDARTDGRTGTATIQFSSRPDVEPLWQDVKAGILRHISVGYAVERFVESTDPTTRTRRLTAVRWTPHEISLVPAPADAGCTVRNGDSMDMTTTAPADTATQTETITRAAPADTGPVTTRAQTNAEIRSMASLTGLGQSWIDAQIDRAATVEQARAAAFEALSSRDAMSIRTEQTRVEMGASHDDPAVRAERMGEALFARIAPNHTLSEPARQYAYATPAEMAKELLHLRGLMTTGMCPASIITRSLHTTSDFPVILGNTVGRVLRAAYQSAPFGIRRLGRQTTLRDFRSRTTVQLSEMPLLEKINEHGEIKAATLAEAKESYRLETFARKLGITRQTLVNDDLGAFSDLSRKFGQAAAETEAKVLVDLLTMNSGTGPVMDDAVVLFHTNHGNAASSAAVISDTSLSAARLAMRTQTGLTGQLITVTPKFLVVPAALETTAEKWLTSVNPTKSADVNVFPGKLELIVEPRLDAKSATRWYLVADPAEIDGLEIAYLAGSNGPLVEPIRDADHDGVTLQVIHDFGCGFVESRGWFSNAGA